MSAADVLGDLACKFRAASVQFGEAIDEYQQTLKQLIESGEMECIGPEEELPDEYMGDYLKWLGVDVE